MYLLIIILTITFSLFFFSKFQMLDFGFDNPLFIFVVSSWQPLKFISNFANLPTVSGT